MLSLFISSNWPICKSCKVHLRTYFLNCSKVRTTDKQESPPQESVTTKSAAKPLVKSSQGYAPAEVITTNENLPSTSALFVNSNDQTTTYLVQCKGKYCEDSLEVYQVTDAKVLKSTRKVQGHARQFNADWYKSYPWLVLCVTRLLAFCTFCHYCFNRNLLTDKYIYKRGLQ